MASTTADLPVGTPPDISQFFEHWLLLPRSGLLPRLADYLDHAPPKLQPFVAIVDMRHEAEPVMRLLGTEIALMTGLEVTGMPLDRLYKASLMPTVLSALRAAVQQPAGYLSHRRVLTSSGRLVSMPSIVLPILRDRSEVMSVLSYSSIDRNSDVAFVDDKLELIQDVSVTAWIDLGAGVPNL